MSDSVPSKSSLGELDTDKPFTAFWFFHHSEQFYALARFSYFGFLIDATFVNAHHTVEYLLKSILMKRLDTQTLKKFGHNLKKLWQEYRKLDQNNPTPDDYIDYLNRYDILRYPNLGGFRRVAWGWSIKEFLEIAKNDAMKAHSGCFNLDDFDEIVYNLRLSYFDGNKEQATQAYMLVNETAKEVLYRKNAFMNEKK